MGISEKLPGHAALLVPRPHFEHPKDLSAYHHNMSHVYSKTDMVERTLNTVSDSGVQHMDLVTMGGSLTC